MPIKPHICSPFQIAALEVPNRLLQAPMAGISTRAFRLQARRFGVGLTATEMISSYGIHFGNKRTLRMLDLVADEHLVSVQLFGNRPQLMAEAAMTATEAGADVIDINMGCPVRKVTGTGAGVALMADEPLAAAIARLVAEAVEVPVTAKIRSGPYAEVTANSLAPKLADAGVAAICIHPRLGKEGRKGRADHRVTETLVSNLEIPVIASGDIDGPASASELFDRCGCDAVMVGRASLGNPWLFADILTGDEAKRRPLPEVISEMTAFHADLCTEMNQERAARFMRKFYTWYLRPFRPGAALRTGLMKATGFDQAVMLIENAFPELFGDQLPPG